MQDSRSFRNMPAIYEYKVKDYIKYMPKYPDNKDLMKLVDVFLSFAKFSRKDDVMIAINLLGEIKSMPQIDQSYQQWAETNTKLLLCKKCKSNPQNKSEYPYFLCQECICNSDNSSKCRLCQASLKNAEYSSTCKHLCLFCACSHLKRGNRACPVCEDDFSNLKYKQTDCDRCGNKSFLEDSVFVLKCEHKLCCDCLKICIKNKKCIEDGKAIPAKTINYIINYVSSLCSKCNQRKYWNKLQKKSCCATVVCIKCQKNQSSCVGCKKVKV